MRNTQETRLCIFLFITILMSWGYQMSYNHAVDEQINEALEGHNKTYKRAVEINRQFRAENEALKHNLIHEQAMYEASKNHVKMLEQQIDVVSHYWSKEYLKISDELFDIKNTDK